MIKIPSVKPLKGERVIWLLISGCRTIFVWKSRLQELEATGLIATVKSRDHANTQLFFPSLLQFKKKSVARILPTVGKSSHPNQHKEGDPLHNRCTHEPVSSR